MHREELTHYSHVLGREMPYTWFGHSGRVLVTFPTSLGRHYENEDFGIIGCLEGKVNAGELQIAAIDSINRESWGVEGLEAWEKLRRHTHYDAFLAQELFPHIHHRSGRNDPIVYGASLGGWQAACFAARHPELVGRVVAFSGIFDLRRLLYGWWSEDAYYYSPADFVSNMDDGLVQRLSEIGWVIATGEHDTLVDQTRNFSHCLRQKGIPVHEEVWGGVFGHDWPFWREHLPRFVP